MDFQNNKNFSDFNSILFGHHMNQGVMFGELDKFGDKQFFETHQQGNIFYEGKNHGIELFAFLHTDAYNTLVFTPNIQGEVPRQEYLDTIKNLSINYRDLGVTPNDRLVVMTTCSFISTNGRDILVGVIREDAFKEVEKEESQPITAILTQNYWPQIIASFLGIILILLCIWVIVAKRHKKENRNIEEHEE